MIDISKINKSKFKFTEDGNFVLIVPNKNMWDWEDDEKKFRSIIVDKRTNSIVSSAWPKFGNFGEFVMDTELLKKELQNGTIRFSHKEDGSLCIRDVIDGKINLRSRGTLYGGVGTEEEDSFGDRFFSVAQKYPKILDPTWQTDKSLLFEYLSPTNTIVIRHKEDDLVFLGFVNYDLSIGRWEEIEEISKEGNLNLVRLHDLPRDPIQLLEEIKNWKEEGVVVRCCNDQVFVKVKSAYYLANHRMKYSLTYKVLLELLMSLNLYDLNKEEELVSFLKDCEYDWEIVESVKELYGKFSVAYSLALNLEKEAEEKCNEFLNQNIEWESEIIKRKEFAKIACSHSSPLKQFMFNIYSGKDNRKLITRLALNQGKF